MLCFLPYYIIGVVTERNEVERGHRGRSAFGRLRDPQGSGDRHFVAPLTSFAPLLSTSRLYINDDGICTLDNIF